MWKLSIPWWECVARALIIYVFLMVLLRLTGKRQVGQLAPFDLVLLLVLSNAVQNAMNGGDNSLISGLILAGVLVVLSYLFEVATYRSKTVERFVQGRPTLLIHQGKLLTKHLEHELLSPHELRAILRHQGIHELHDVDQAILESDGFVSVVRKSELAEHPQPTSAGTVG